jgi:formate C-acetyltransferase
MGTYDVCANMTVRVEDFELIVGNKAKTFCGSGFNPDWMGSGWVMFTDVEGTWTLKEDGLYHNPKVKN